jgi:hypothetical protein
MHARNAAQAAKLVVVSLVVVQAVQGVVVCVVRNGNRI